MVQELTEKPATTAAVPLNPEMKRPSEAEAAVVSVLRRFSDAYKARDADAAISLFMPGDETVMIASEEGEIAVGFSQVERFTREFVKCDALDFELKWGSVRVSGNVAWVATVLSATDSRQEETIGRFTAVLEQRDGQWLFVQMHFSFPSPFGTENETEDCRFAGENDQP